MIHKLMAATFTVVVALGMAGLMPISTVSAEEVAVPGNNGTLKVHELGTASGTESNDPKVCKFNFEGFGFDNFQEGYIMIETQGGSTPVGENVGPVNVGPANESGYFESMYFNNGGTVVKDGTYKATLYGKDNPSDEESLAVEKAKSKVFKVDCEPVVVGVPGSAVSLVCPVNTYKLTVSNTGTTDLKVEVNGVDKTITQGGTAITADFNVGDVLTVKIDGEPVMVGGKLLNNFKLVTCQGMGSTVTTKDTNPPANTTTNVSTGFGAGAATNVASLPVTSGSSAQLAAVIVTLGSAIAAAGAYVVRARNGFAI